MKYYAVFYEKILYSQLNYACFIEFEERENNFRKCDVFFVPSGDEFLAKRTEPYDTPQSTEFEARPALALGGRSTVNLRLLFQV